MFTVKYYSRDKFLGEENFRDLEKAEDSLYESDYSTRSDYYEIIDCSTNRIVQEFVIPTFDLPLTEAPEEGLLEENRNLDWKDLTDEDW